MNDMVFDPLKQSVVKMNASTIAVVLTGSNGPRSPAAEYKRAFQGQSAAVTINGGGIPWSEGQLVIALSRTELSCAVFVTPRVARVGLRTKSSEHHAESPAVKPANYPEPGFFHYFPLT